MDSTSKPVNERVSVWRNVIGATKSQKKYRRERRKRKSMKDYVHTEVNYNNSYKECKWRLRTGK